MKGDCGVAGEGRLVGVPKFITCTMPLMNINSDWVSNASSCLCNYTCKVTAPQDTHKRLVLKVHLGSNTLEFSAIHR